MTAPFEEAWWGPEATGAAHPAVLADGSPVLLAASSAPAVRAVIADRIPAFTPDWNNPDPSDAGVALIRLFGLLIQPVLARADRLPEKALADYLRMAGVTGRSATAASTFLQFTVSPAAGGSVTVPAGFQAGAAPATGTGDEVVFETERGLSATPLAIAGVAVERSGVVTRAALGGSPVAPFGDRPRPRNAFWIALAPAPGVASPAPSMTMGVIAAGGTPAPAAGMSGGLPAGPARPLVIWELLNGTRVVPADVVRDETDGLRRTGLVELATPSGWRPGRPAGSAEVTDLFWVRARLVSGDFPVPPALTDVRVNLMRATAARTIRDEPLERAGADPDGRTVMVVGQAPVLPGSLEITVDGDPLGDIFGTGRSNGSSEPGTGWHQVGSLAAAGPADRVFELDPVTGRVTFGDGVHGARVPDGFRNVRAVVYRSGGGIAGTVAAGAVGTVLTSIGYVTAATNPFPAVGGADPEPSADAVRRGGRELRAGDRAVTAADYDVLALRVPGARVARAHGVIGLHPDYPGRPIPGVVGVLVVPPDDAVHTADGPPVPSGEELRAVADFLAGAAAPTGVEVVTAAPRYHRVRLAARLVVNRDDDQADILRRVGAAIDTYLSPVRGGDDGTGWPFGAPLRHVDLVRRLLVVAGVLAVPQLAVVLDGRRSAPCADTPISAYGLIWPGRHELVPVDQGGVA